MFNVFIDFSFIQWETYTKWIDRECVSVNFLFVMRLIKVNSRIASNTHTHTELKITICIKVSIREEHVVEIFPKSFNRTFQDPYFQRIRPFHIIQELQHDCAGMWSEWNMSTSSVIHVSVQKYYDMYHEENILLQKEPSTIIILEKKKKKDNLFVLGVESCYKRLANTI